MYSIFIFFFLYSNSKIKYIKKDQFLHLRMFGKLFWIHNLNIKFIMHGFVLFSNFFLKVTFFTYTLTSIRWGPLHFHNIYRIVIVFVFYENEDTENVFSFLYSKPTFRIPKMKTEYKFLYQASFLWWVPLKTKNENKKQYFL